MDGDVRGSGSVAPSKIVTRKALSAAKSSFESPWSGEMTREM